MRIFGNGQNPDDRALLIGGHCRMTVGAFIEFPAVILAALRRRRLVVDLLPVVLTDIGDEQITGFLVEVEHVGVAQTIGPDLGPRPYFVCSEALLRDPEQLHQLRLVGLGERVVLWNCIRCIIVGIDVDTQKLAPQDIQILSRIERIAFPTGVPLADIELAVSGPNAIMPP